MNKALVRRVVHLEAARANARWDWIQRLSDDELNAAIARLEARIRWASADGKPPADPIYSAIWK